MIMLGFFLNKNSNCLKSFDSLLKVNFRIFFLFSACNLTIKKKEKQQNLNSRL